MRQDRFSRVLLLTSGVAFLIRLRRLLRLPSTEEQSRGTRDGRVMKGHCVVPSNFILLSISVKFPARYIKTKKVGA